ncbi:MFS transporter [Massilia dura]|uniref:MFS transporter n=1 Tax=Pseudoduganella dura TaxID=321982 RepID=A0A6I3XN86_9BURK|nr:MFS transporter [Pseudoduganella dura]MUI14088.1 MFS transporter [Pseudoduganella dura]GGX77208.1 MFS transporter [Pseudoduganella dura]
MEQVKAIRDEVDRKIAPAAAPARVGRYRWVVLGLIFVIWAIACADRANLGIALPYMKKEYGISNTEAGMIISLFSFAYGVVQIPAGLLYKRLSNKVTGALFPVFMILTSVFTGLMGTTSSVFLLKFFRIGLGISEGPLGIGCTNIINRWFPAREKGTATGLWLTASKLGPLIVPSVCVVVIEVWGWREIFYVFAIPGILLSILWIFTVTNTPEESRFCSKAECDYIRSEAGLAVGEPASSAVRRQYNLAWLDTLIRTRKVPQLNTLRHVFTSWNILGAAIGYGCMIGITNIFMSWIPTYLVEVKGFTSIKMGFLASAPFLGAVMGNLLGGLVSDRLLGKRRKPLMMLSAFGTIFMMLALVNAPDNAAYLGFTLFMAGLTVSAGFGGYAVYPMGLASKASYPVSFGIINSVGQVGGACAPLFAGMLLDTYSWSAVFTYMGCSALVCLLILFTIVEPVIEPEKSA